MFGNRTKFGSGKREISIFVPYGIYLRFRAITHTLSVT
jgi:hypothetical protein